MGMFGKISEGLKLFKKSDKDVYCANCGARTGLITRTWLLDDRCLCVNCQNALPSYFKNKYGTMTLEQNSKVHSYISAESKELSKKFEKKHSFLDLQLDAVNGILCYKTAKSVPMYVKLENIANFSLECHCRSAQKQYGTVTMTLECIEPNFYIIENLESIGSEDDCYKFMEYYYSIRDYRENVKQGE